MLRILIIDDEVLVRVGLKSMIDWEKNGYQIIGEAANGDEGMGLIEERNPDIVITDIKMPVKDGLELIKEVSGKNKGSENNDCKFIVLSSFDEFHLVKEAMKLGAVDYLIKLELDNKLLLNTLDAVKDSILEEREKSRNEKIIEHSINQKKSYKKEVFKRLIGNLLNDKDEIELIMDEIGIYLNNQALFCMILRINNHGVLKKFEKGDSQLFEFSIINIIEEIVSDYFKAYSFMNGWGEIVVIYSLENETLSDDYYDKVDEMASVLSTMLKQYFAVNVSISVSNLHNGFENISAAYLESYEAQEYCFQSSAGQAVFYKEIGNYQKESAREIDIRDFSKNFKEMLDLLELQSIENLFTDLINKIKKYPPTRNQAYELCFQIIYLIKSKMNTDIVENVIDSDEEFYRCIESLNNITELTDWLGNIMERILTSIKNYLKNEKRYIITEAEKYIRNHFREELNLSDLAENLNISAAYLSSIFKDIVGVSFTEYLTKLRIEEAKELLNNSSFKIYQISEMVGYNNPYYFSRVFKNSTGRTPSEYRLKKY